MAGLQITNRQVRNSQRPGSLAVFAGSFLAILGLHLPLLRLPYFWDEAGYYIPAARDFLLSGSLIPSSTLSNAHPPLVMVWLATAWKLLGFRPLISRLAMLLVAAFTLTAVYRLAHALSSREVALGTTLCTALYPVFFAQSTLAHLDMAAAGFTLWGLLFYLQYRRAPAVAMFTLAALSKETAIITPLALWLWEFACRRRTNSSFATDSSEPSGRWRKLLWHCAQQPAPSLASSFSLLLPLLPLCAWFTYHYARTGYVLGNPEFVRYNLVANLHPLRIVIATGLRLWQLLAYMNLFVLTLATLLALRLAPIPEIARARHKAEGNGERRVQRPRIALPAQAVFAVVIVAHIAVLAVLGGALLARYLLPVYPLVILLCVSTLWRRVPWWTAYLLLVCAGFTAALLIPPPYYSAPEDSLVYARYIRLHQAAAQMLEKMASRQQPAVSSDDFTAADTISPRIRVLTAWPASDELTHPYLGYVARPIPVLRIDNFSAAQLLLARAAEPNFDAAYLFSTKFEPPYRSFLRFPFWETIQQRYFDYHRDLKPSEAAELLGGRLTYERQQRGEWVAILRPEGVQEAMRQKFTSHRTAR